MEGQATRAARLHAEGVGEERGADVGQRDAEGEARRDDSRLWREGTGSSRFGGGGRRLEIGIGDFEAGRGGESCRPALFDRVCQNFSRVHENAVQN